MASTNKTSLGLPKWVLSDKPDMTDYNDAFEKIDGELAKRAVKDNTLQSGLFAALANDLRNPNDGVTRENIFANPPLDKMSGFNHHTFHYDAPELGQYKTPLENGSAQWWEILTFNTSSHRAVQIAIQVFNTKDNGAVFIRTRHIDNNDFTKWQDWKRLQYMV